MARAGHATAYQPGNLKNTLIKEYLRLYSHRSLRYSDNHLADSENQVTAAVIRWRNSVSSDHHEAANSAGFYWVTSNMAYYADADHTLERCSVRATGKGIKVYYRSPAFWQASASVNLPGQVDDTEYRGLNGFIERCCVYGNAISVLTEQKFPDKTNNLVNEKPESDPLRRD